MPKTAVVSQVGKFFKVITNDGEDISNQIERPLRKKAIDLGKALEFDEVKKCWKISGEDASEVKTTAVKTKVSAVEKLEEIILKEAPKKRKRKVYTTFEMPKPTFKIGSVVDVVFIGSKKKVKLTELKKNPTNTMRWIYNGEEVATGLKIPFIGIEDTEDFANIVIEEKE